MKNLKQKMAVALLMLTFLFISAAGWNPAEAEAESITYAKAYTLGTKCTGMITENGDTKQYYKFTLQESGKITLTGSARMSSVKLHIYDENAIELWSDEPGWNSTSEVISISDYDYLTGGSYYFCVEKNIYAQKSTGEFEFLISFTAAGESFRESNGGSNNSLETASIVRTDGTLYHAQLSLNDEKDFFKFTLERSGKVNLSATFYGISRVEWKLYDGNGVELLSEEPGWNTTTENIVINDDVFLTSGTYYAVINTYEYAYHPRGRYDFSLSFASSNESFAETNGGSNNTIATASSLTLGNSYKGQIAINDEKDFYKFTLSSSQTVTIRVEAGMEHLYVKLYDSSGEELKSWVPRKNSVSQKINLTETAVLEQGMYYLAVVHYNYGGYGDYTLNVSSLSKANCPHERYESKWYAPTYFAKGYRKYTCVLCGHSYKGDYQPVRRLGQGYFYSYCYAGKGKLSLSWFRVSDASGYQIRYCRNKKFRNGVVTKMIKGQAKSKKTLSKLKRKKKYYVQIRAFKKSGGKTVYGKWSAKKCLKTR